MLIKRALKHKFFCPSGHLLHSKMEIAYAIPNKIIHNPICLKKGTYLDIMSNSNDLSTYENTVEPSLDFDIDLLRRLDVSDNQEEDCLNTNIPPMRTISQTSTISSITENVPQVTNVTDDHLFRSSVCRLTSVDSFPQKVTNLTDEEKTATSIKHDTNWLKFRFYQYRNSKCTGKRKGKQRMTQKVKVPRLLTIQEASRPGPSSAGINDSEIAIGKSNFQEMESSSASSQDTFSDLSEDNLPSVPPTTPEKINSINFPFSGSNPCDAHEVISRPKRSVKRRLEKSCPICDLSLIPHKVAEHFEKEKHDLCRLMENMKKKKLRKSKSQEINQKELFIKVKARRTQRVIAQHDVLKCQKTTFCPFCETPVQYENSNDWQQHYEQCVSQAGSSSSIEDSGYDNSYEEENFINIGSGNVVRLKSTNEDLPLDVEIQEEDEFGEQQYFHGDLISCNASNEQVNEEVNEALNGVNEVPTGVSPSVEIEPRSDRSTPIPPGLGCSASGQSSSDCTLGGSENNRSTGGQPIFPWMKKVHVRLEKTTDDDFDSSDETNSRDLVINSLKEKIKELLAKLQSSPTCAVCIGPYRTPLVSVVCWHVLCEKCWLTAIAVSSLCPLCKEITNARHLRRIFI